MEEVHNFDSHIEELYAQHNPSCLDIYAMWLKSVDAIDLTSAVEYSSNAIFDLLGIHFVILAQGLSRIKINRIH
jgi:hypothetical protein